MATREAEGARRFVPENADLPALAAAVKRCEGCDLHVNATQAVFSRGEPTASIALVGEQPGDMEDLQGKPFVGPAGHVLVSALREAGVSPQDVYVTNAVKHFKFEQRGKRRIHQRPQRVEIIACRPWLLAEFRVVTPKVVVALGATAASALFGPSFRVTKQRGQVMAWPDASDRPEDFGGAAASAKALATIHPSAVLRADDRDLAYRGLVRDLEVAAKLLG
jgi:DNA polymerase